MRPAGQRNPPMSHRTVSIRGCRRLKSANRCAVIEAEEKIQSLVKYFCASGEFVVIVRV